MFNKKYMGEIKYNLFRTDDTYPEKVRRLDPYRRDGYSVTATNLKTEFRDVRSTFMKALKNFHPYGREGDGKI